MPSIVIKTRGIVVCLFGGTPELIFCTTHPRSGINAGFTVAHTLILYITNCSPIKSFNFTRAVVREASRRNQPPLGEMRVVTATLPARPTVMTLCHHRRRRQGAVRRLAARICSRPSIPWLHAIRPRDTWRRGGTRRRLTNWVGARPDLPSASFRSKACFSFDRDQCCRLGPRAHCRCFSEPTSGKGRASPPGGERPFFCPAPTESSPAPLGRTG